MAHQSLARQLLLTTEKSLLGAKGSEVPSESKVNRQLYSTMPLWTKEKKKTADRLEVSRLDKGGSVSTG